MKKEQTYEEAMQKLEKLASQMENNELGIDELVEKLKEAQKLIRFCKEQLINVDKEIQQTLAGDSEGV